MLLEIISLIAIAAQSMTAALLAGRYKMDWFGVCILGCVTSLGGGTLRDIMLGHYPLAWVTAPHYLLVSCGASILTIALARIIAKLRLTFLLLDAVGLVVFTVIGANVALGMGHSPFIVIIFGMITGCVGGVLRDVLCNEVPLLFGGELYATVSIVTGAAYLFGLWLGLDALLVAMIAMALGFGLRALVIVKKLEMPKFVFDKDLG